MPFKYIKTAIHQLRWTYRNYISTFGYQTKIKLKWQCYKPFHRQEFYNFIIPMSMGNWGLYFKNEMYFLKDILCCQTNPNSYYYFLTITSPKFWCWSTKYLFVILADYAKHYWQIYIWSIRGDIHIQLTLTELPFVYITKIGLPASKEENFPFKITKYLEGPFECQP